MLKDNMQSRLLQAFLSKLIRQNKVVTFSCICNQENSLGKIKNREKKEFALVFKSDFIKDPPSQNFPPLKEFSNHEKLQLH